jgi:serine/threonine-protein kinase SRPK3
MLDKWAFAMSKIDGDDTTPTVEKAGLSTTKRGPSTDLAAEVGNVSLDTRAGYVGREHSLTPHDQPSSSSTRPVPVPGSGRTEELEQVSSSVMSIDPQSDESLLHPEASKITVKIADLGNGKH